MKKRLILSCAPVADLMLRNYLNRDDRITIKFGHDLLVGEHVISLVARVERIAIEYDLPDWHDWTAEDSDRIGTLTRRGYTIINVYSEDIYYHPDVVCEMLASIVQNRTWTSHTIRSGILRTNTASDSQYQDDSEVTSTPLVDDINRSPIGLRAQRSLTSASSADAA